VVLGVTTNLRRLQGIVAHPAFARGEVHTGFIDEHLATTVPSGDPPAEAVAAAIAALHAATPNGRSARAVVPDPWARLGPWRLV
jgi:acetyl/propionyl-CoA carboxylase alpha subunit